MYLQKYKWLAISIFVGSIDDTFLYMINQKLLELLLDVTHIFIGIFDVQQRLFIKINRCGLDMFETTTEEHLCEIFNMEFLSEEKLNQIQEKLTLQRDWEEEALLTTGNGKQFWGKVEINHLAHEGKTYLLIRITNIDKYKKAERKAQGSEERFKAVFENAAIGIIVTDATGDIVIANHFIQSLFGYTPHELLGQKVEILIPENLRVIHTKHRAGFTKLHKIRPMGEGLELKAQHKDGSQFPVEVSLSYFYDKGQLFVVSFIQDISFEVQAAQQLHNQKAAIEQLNASLETEVVSRTQALLETLQHLEKSKEDLEKALAKEKELGELKSRFVSMASHEFRTPLSAILSSSILIGKYKTLEEQEKRQKHINRIQSSVGYLTDILEEFLSVGKLEEGRIKVEVTPLDWLSLMEEIKADMSSVLKKGQCIVFRHQGHTHIRLDKSLLRKVLINLLSNAIKFSPEDATITIESAAHADNFTVSVKDHGIGIAESDMKHLFGRFFRGSNATNIQGTGLGLHIVAKYVELMNGKIDIESKLGMGTSISLAFFPTDNKTILDLQDTFMHNQPVLSQ